MRNELFVLTAVLGLTILLPDFAGSLLGQTSSVPERRLALVGGTIYTSPTENPIQDGVILIQQGKIAAVGKRRSLNIPQGVEVIDCSGMTVTAGYWNSHVHFFERKWANAATIPAPELGRQLQDMLTRYGFTSVFDLSSIMGWNFRKGQANPSQIGQISLSDCNSHGPPSRGRLFSFLS